MNASSFWGTFDLLLGREARKNGGQDALKVAHWVSAYAGVRKLPGSTFGVNLPRVTAQLEKLMGTNVVRLTDRKYMQDLQRRIQEDYNVTLEKRIQEREYQELERQKYLILNGKYNRHNCPKRLIPLHSIVLAKELDRERSLILSGAGDAIPQDFSSSVFSVNKKSNLQICSRREKLKTIREKNAERLIKQGLRWERERLQMEDFNRQQEIERRSRREALLEKEKLYMIEDNERALNLLRLKTKKGPCRDMDLRALLMQQRVELGEKIQQRDFDMNEEKRMESDRSSEKKKHHKKKKPKKAVDALDALLLSPEEGYISMNQAESPSDLDGSVTIKIEKGSKDSGDDTDPLDDVSTADTGEGAAGGGSEVDDAEAAEAEAMKEEMNKVLEKKKLKARNEDPKITRLKEADTVDDIYNIADEIIVLEKKKAKKGVALK
ncbi:uncharacterized protein LOC131431891 isoform X3 [Malaya genurostris]|uniref:uncharacterized protein LOC131431891 isoform X3 n=1 Tax=Malaya genurostris TaxID=325434 RepID=UPI0026F38CFB|nr:uncharacterized protein LOC131431891 isoform X3 [Malaya genurostris]